MSELTREQVEAIARAVALRIMAEKGVTQTRVNQLIEERVPAFILGMDPQPPGGDTQRALLGFDADTLVWRTMQGGAASNDFHFKGTQGSATSVTFIGGTWTRNGIPVELAEDGVANVITVAADDYVWLLLTSTAQDPALKPDGVELAAGTLPTDAATEGIHLVLGKMTSGVWEQWHHGGDHDDWVVVPDGETNLADTPVRKTLEFNPATGAHAGEMQLFDVDTALDQQMLTIDAFGTPIKTSYHYAAMIKTTEDGAIPYLTGAGTGPEGGTQTAQFSVLRTRSGGTNIGFTVDGTTLSINYQHIPVVVADGRLMFDLAADGESSASIDLASIVSAHNHDGDYAAIGHGHTHDDISDWADYFQHQFLADIVANADAVDDHDGRYWPSDAATPFTPDTKSYRTTGTVAADKIIRYVSGGANPNRWEDSIFTVAIGVSATLIMDTDIALATTGSFKMDTLTGRTVRVRAFDPDTGEQVTLKFYKGLLVEE